MLGSFVNSEGGGVQGGGRIIIQSVLGQSRLNTFSQRAKHKVMGNTGNLMETEVAFVERFENPTNEWCFVWLQRWKGATPAPSWADSKTEQKKKRKAERRRMFSQKVLVRPLCSYEAEGSIQWWWVHFNGAPQIYASFGLVIGAIFILQTPFGLVFHPSTISHLIIVVATLYVASRLVSTLLHALLWEPKVFVPIWMFNLVQKRMPERYDFLFWSWLRLSGSS